METCLDEFYTTFLHAAAYTEGELRIVVAEGIRRYEPEGVAIGSHVIKCTHAIDATEGSRLVEIRFFEPIAWQLVDESFTTFDEYEVRDDEFALQALSRSRYLDYVRANHGWFEDVRGPGKHYRIWAQNEIVDVIACEPPTIVLRPGAGPGPSESPTTDAGLAGRVAGRSDRLV